MKELVQNIMISFTQMREKQKVITLPSIPILYFGNHDQYQKSNPKVITVGLNPSNKEFPIESRFSRFPDSEHLDTSKILSENDIFTYLTSLNNYFNRNPNNWFDSYDPVSNGMNTSYYMNKAGNNVLHTNFCSPFATDLAWSKLKTSIQYTLSREGRKFWHKLVEILEPDIVLFSSARKYVERVMFKKSRWETYARVTKKKDGSPRAKPYNIEVAEIQIGDKKTYLVFGQIIQLPFGTLSNDIKIQLGQELINLLN